MTALFVVKQFQEATPRITTAAKAEVEVYVTGPRRSIEGPRRTRRRRPALLPSSHTVPTKDKLP